MTLQFFADPLDHSKRTQNSAAVHRTEVGFTCSPSGGFTMASAVTTLGNYSSVPNRSAGPNKRTGGKILG